MVFELNLFVWLIGCGIYFAIVGAGFQHYYGKVLGQGEQVLAREIMTLGAHMCAYGMLGGTATWIL